MSDLSLFEQLRKRKVVQSAAIYCAIAWGAVEVVVTIVEQLMLPQWVATVAVIAFVVGFPVFMFLAWTFDLTSQGLQRTVLDGRRRKASVAASMLLLIAGTAGLFYLIKPALQHRQGQQTQVQADSVVPNSLAVLPFENTGPDQADTWLSEGLSDELRDQLGRVLGIRIAARISSVAAREQRLDAQEISSKLGVANLVEGSVRRQGDKLLVSVSLIEGASGLAIWSETYERGPNELLNVQMAIARQVTLHVLPDAEPVVAAPATRDATANELMLLARHYEQQVRERQDFDEKTLLEAVQLYRRAAEIDPESALAQSRLAGALLFLGDLEAAAAPIFKAMSIAPNWSEVQNTLGEYYWVRGLTSEAGTAWAYAIELNPDNPDALSNYAWFRWTRIQTENVKDMYRHALQVDRLNLERYAQLGTFLGIEGVEDETRQLIRRVEDLFDNAVAYRVIGTLHSYLGDVDKSIAWTIRARRLEPDNPAHVAKLAEYYADIGDFETALDLDPDGIGILFKMRSFEETIDSAEMAMLDEPDDLRVRGVLAMAHNAIGNYEAAIHVLKDTGLPDSMINGWRTGEESDAYLALTNALYGAGESKAAHGLARWREDSACNLLILGEHDQARAMLGRAQNGLHLAWDPVLKDSPCFQRFREDPVYQATVRHFDERRAMLRGRLSSTLESFGVDL
jgi:TolB-like protein